MAQGITLHFIWRKRSQIQAAPSRVPCLKRWDWRLTNILPVPIKAQIAANGVVTLPQSPLCFDFSRAPINSSIWGTP